MPPSGLHKSSGRHVHLQESQGKESEAEWRARRAKSLAEIDARLMVLVHALFQVRQPANDRMQSVATALTPNRILDAS